MRLNGHDADHAKTTPSGTRASSAGFPARACAAIFCTVAMRVSITTRVPFARSAAASASAAATEERRLLGMLNLSACMLPRRMRCHGAAAAAEPLDIRLMRVFTMAGAATMAVLWLRDAALTSPSN